MLIGMIRPVEATTLEVTGTSLEGIHAQLTAQTPDGYKPVNTPITIISGT